MKTTRTSKSTHKASTSIKQATINDLPWPIVTDILSRLPVKAIAKCRCVSKNWLTLLSDPHFVTVHLLRSSVSLLTDMVEDRIFQFDFDSFKNKTDVTKFYVPNPDGKCHPIASCNGLVLFYHEYNCGDMYICNPALGEYVRIPGRSNFSFGHHDTYFFGYSPKTSEYKILRTHPVLICDPTYKEPYSYGEYYEAEVLTVGSGCWRVIENVPSNLQVMIANTSNTFVNGAHHWRCFDGNNTEFIRCFDFETEQFRIVPNPPQFVSVRGEDKSGRVTIGKFRDRLCFCDASSGDHFDLWVMNKYGVQDSWTKEEFVVKDGFTHRMYEPILVLRSGQILMLAMSELGYFLVAYDPRLQGFWNYLITGTPALRCPRVHIPSFISLTHLDEVVLKAPDSDHAITRGFS